MKTHTLHFFLIGAFAIMYGWLGLSAYWTLYPYTIFQFNGPTTEVVNKTLKPGDPIILKGNAVQLMKGVHCIASRTLEDDIKIPYAATSEFTTVGGTATSTAAVAVVPLFATPGTYRLRNEFVCQVNPIRKITVVRYSDDFQVVPALSTGHVGA